jgi:hypothetical protein
MGEPINQQNLVCAKCRASLKPGNVTLSYMGSNFPVELYKCPTCGLVYIPEALATGKMQQVEAALEDK